MEQAEIIERFTRVTDLLLLMDSRQRIRVEHCLGKTIMKHVMGSSLFRFDLIASGNPVLTVPARVLTPVRGCMEHRGDLEKDLEDLERFVAETGVEAGWF